MSAKVKFYLKNSKALGESMIYMAFYYSKYRMKLSTGLTIDPASWNFKKQRPRIIQGKTDHIPTFDTLEKNATLLNTVYRKMLNDGLDPTPDELKKEYILAQKTNPLQKKREMGFWDHFEKFLEYQKTRVCHDVYKDLDNSLRKHLKNCEKRYNMHLSFDELKNKAGGFVEKFDDYLTYKIPKNNGELGLATNTVGKQFKNLKSFLNYCFAKDICPPFSMKHMITKSEDVDKVWLNEDEINLIYKYKAEKKDIEECRDMFIVGCETGLRFSDFTRISPVHVHGDDIVITQNKTIKPVIIPISGKTRSILNKYSNRLPGNHSVTDFNANIRIAAEKAGIKEDIVISRKKGNVKTEEFRKKHELVSSHTARRSFCTNKFLMGMPAHEIMVLSGHKTERAFMRYLKIDSFIVARNSRKYFN
jgi:integrase